MQNPAINLATNTVQVSTLGPGKASKTYSILDDDDPLLSVGDSGSSSPVNPAINSGNTDGDDALLEESSVGNALEHTGNPTLNRVTKVVIGIVTVLAGLSIVINLWIFAQILNEKQAGVAMPTVLPGLDGSTPVQLTIEPNGMVHINASTMHDAFYAQGAVTARLRLWQMEFQRRVGSGTLSAAVGSAALGTDKLMRTLGVYAAANASFYAMSPEGQAKVQAYADGVNAYLDSKPTLPIEFRLLGVNPSPWKPADSIVWAKLMSLSLSGNMNTELLRFMLMTERGASLAKVNELLPPFDTVQFPTVLQPADVCPGGAAAGANYSQHCNNSKAAAWLNPLRSQRQQARQRRSSNGSSLLPNKQSAEHALPQFFRRMDEGGMIRGASNNWVVHGNRTAAGKPLLCNDPHLDLTAPSIWILGSNN
eukprot:gene17776-5464_t